jgi:hypothetical protein
MLPLVKWEKKIFYYGKKEADQTSWNGFVSGRSATGTILMRFGLIRGQNKKLMNARG